MTTRSAFLAAMLCLNALSAHAQEDAAPLPPPVDEPTPPPPVAEQPAPPPPPTEEPLPQSPAPSTLSWPGAIAGLAASLGMQAGVCAPLAAIGCVMTTGPVLFFTQGSSGNACWMVPLAAVGGVMALALAVVGPLGGAVIVQAVHDMTVGGRSPLFTVAAVAVAATWLAGVVLAVPVAAMSLLALIVVGPTLQRLGDERARERKTGFSSEMLGLWAGSVLMALVLVALCALLFVVGSAVPVFLADVLTRSPNDPPPPRRAPRIRRRRRPAG